MSAFMVDPEHIDAILTIWIALADRRTCKHHVPHDLVSDRQKEATDKGRMLLRENMRSVDARYPADISPTAEELIGGYTYTACPLDLYRFEAVIGRAFKILACYEYQACEHSGWESSEACKFIERIRDELITRLPGYNDSGLWGITDRNVFRL